MEVISYQRKDNSVEVEVAEAVDSDDFAEFILDEYGRADTRFNVSEGVVEQDEHLYIGGGLGPFAVEKNNGPSETHQVECHFGTPEQLEILVEALERKTRQVQD